MKIVYLSNFFNAHQKPLADCLFKATKGEYCFIETKEFPEDRKKLGLKEYKEDYVLRYNEDNRDQIDRMIMEAEAVICGEAPSSMVKRRVNQGLLTFRDDERRYKALVKYLKYPIYTYHSLIFNKGYLLCASAFGARDYVLSGMKPNKCFKWGYFPEVKEYDSVDELINRKKGLKHPQDVSILWVGRLIGWKHPEMAIELALRLKKAGYSFVLNMIGEGYLKKEIEKLVAIHDLANYVKVLGALGQNVVKQYMENSDIFIFTSDQNEGWGAVLNESMNCACAVVAGHMIGSVPFLIKDGENGLIFKSKDSADLYAKVKELMDNTSLRESLGREAYLTITQKWSAQTACVNLLKLIESLKKGEEPSIAEGPCSKAPILDSKWNIK